MSGSIPEKSATVPTNNSPSNQRLKKKETKENEKHRPSAQKREIAHPSAMSNAPSLEKEENKESVPLTH